MDHGWTECPVTANIDAPDSLDAIDIQLYREIHRTCAIGAGCITGPAVMNLSMTAQKPCTLQRACIVGNTIGNRVLLPRCGAAS
jgi:hypothetical protein